MTEWKVFFITLFATLAIGTIIIVLNALPKSVKIEHELKQTLRHSDNEQDEPELMPPIHMMEVIQ